MLSFNGKKYHELNSDIKLKIISIEWPNVN